MTASRITAIAWLALATGTAHAALEFETKRIEREVDMGTEQVVADFPFTNTGSETVIIRNIGSSCGCAVAKMKSTEFAPGESGVVPVVFEIGDRYGRQIKTLRVQTSAGETTLTLAVLIEEAVLLSRRIAFWRIGAPPEPVEITVTVQRKGGLDLAGVDGEGGRIRVETRVIEPGKQFVVVLTPLHTDEGVREDLSLRFRPPSGGDEIPIQLRARIR